jgi:hypothetical protein
LAFKPPLGSLPSFLVHAGDLATEHRYLSNFGQRQHREVGYAATCSEHSVRRNKQAVGKRTGARRGVQLEQRNTRRPVQVELDTSCVGCANVVQASYTSARERNSPRRTNTHVTR